MNKNKKTILGFAMAMIFSLALMQGVATTSNKQDMSLQQISIGAAYMSGETEDGASEAWGQVSDLAETYAEVVGGAAGAAWVLTGTNPVGWGVWASVAGAAL